MSNEGFNDEESSAKLTEVEAVVIDTFNKDSDSNPDVVGASTNVVLNSVAESVSPSKKTNQLQMVIGPSEEEATVQEQQQNSVQISSEKLTCSERNNDDIQRSQKWTKNVAKESNSRKDALADDPRSWSSSPSSSVISNGAAPGSLPLLHQTAAESGGQWTCNTCTYYNFSNVSSCFQCNAPRVSNNPKWGDQDGINSALIPLKISDCCEGESSESVMGGRRDITAPPSSAFCGGSFYERTNDSSSSLSGNGSHNMRESSVSSYGDYWSDPPMNSETDEKWACSLCTFENWPASTKCSMCYTVRELFNSGRSSSNHHLQDSSNNNVENNRLLSESIANSSYAQRLRNRKLEAETRWLEACRGVVVGNIAPVEEYLARGGDPARQLTATEVDLLNRPSAFDVGYTLVHLALRFQHQETLAMLLGHLDCSNSSFVVKRVPSYVAPDLDQDIRNHVMGTIRYGKGNFRCNFSSEIATFTLPAGIQELSSDTRETLYDEILDGDVQKELESGQFINWSPELTVQLNSRLYALWNRSAGDCLLDSVLQATWGIFDKDNRLRQSLANSLRESASLFYQRWRENEILLSHMLDFSLDETQCAADWDNLLSIAGQPGSSLEQLHIFALAHIFRRPIIVYSVKFVKSYLGETLGYARYEGVYLPFLWDSCLCWKWPIALGYTRGHFSALVPQEPHCDPLLRASAAQLDGDGINSRCTYLPLNTVDGNLLPIHFLSQAEVGNEEMILSQWLDLCYTNAGILVARQRIQKRPLLVAQLVEEWLNHYRTLGQMTSTSYMRQSATTCYSSDGDSDND